MNCMKLLFISLLMALPALASCQQLLTHTHIPKQPYYKFVIASPVTDSITFYLSEFDKEKKLPLVVFIQGSGNQSHFLQVDNNIRPNYGHINLCYTFQGKAKVLIVEKPGIQYLQTDRENPGFDKNFSLQSWTK